MTYPFATPPNRATRPDTLDDDADAFFGDVPAIYDALVAMYNAFNAGMAGGAYAIPYIFDSATADADPTAGKLRLNNAAQSSATALRLDLVSSGIGDVTALIDRFDSSTSAVKGSIRLTKQGDLTKWLVFDVVARASPAGYRNITITNGAGSSASPFINGDALILYFQRSGEKGDLGPSSYDVPMIHVREELAAGTSPTVAPNSNRGLNTVKTNTISGASLSSGGVTLPAGTYVFEASAPMATNGVAHRIALYNGSAGAIITYGATEHCTNASTADITQATVRGRFVLAAPGALYVQHVFSGANSLPGGEAMNSGTEIYAEAIYRKVA